MPIIKITAADLARQKVVDAKWYGAQIVKISDPTKSAAGDSVNIVYTFRIEGADGKEIDHNFNSKGWILMGELMSGISNKPVTLKEGEELQVNTDEHLMQKVDVHLYVDNYNNRLSNKIDHFLPYSKGTSQAVAF